MNTNIIKICFIMIAAGFLWYACGEEESIGQQPIDSVPPSPVSGIQVTNIPGGAILTYTLPDDEDLLYVKAVYTRNSETCESRTSLYKDSLKVEGFGDMQSREVRVIAVDRSRNESTPVTATVQPLEPEVITIGNTLDMVTAFGGCNINWDNPNRAEISVTVLQDDEELMEAVAYETFYSSMAKGQGVIRELDTVIYKFGVYVQDHWGNRSEVKNFELMPLFETKFDPANFRDASLPGDGPHYGGGYQLSNIWDGVWGSDNSYSSQAGSGNWPGSITVDLGVVGKISRIRLHQRMGSYQTWGEGNPRNFEVWGSLNVPDPSGSWDSWTKFMECESIKPSGLPGTEYSNEDVSRALDGEDFYNENIDFAVRYLRLRIYRTWSGGDNIQIGEMEVFGDNR
ncbi:MAG: DUF4959 domain-containing protein [Tannerella sp.]|jgi:hypothetical protein|nr:DUF4959 domain-containing protein [Tannerella sp.]